MRLLLLLCLALPAAAAPGDTAALGLYPVTVDGRAGYIDRTGAIAIKPQFDAANAFFEGRAVIEMGIKRTPSGALTGGTHGYIDSTGKVVVPAIYRTARPFHEGLAAVDLDRKKGYIDPTGKVVIPLQYERARNFHEGRAAVEVTRKRWAYIDTKGQIVFWAPPDADMGDPSDFSEGHVAIEYRRGGQRGTRYHDRQGKVVLDIPHPIARDLSEGLIAVRVKAKNAWGFMNLAGKWVLEPQYRFAWSFKGGRAIVSRAPDASSFIDPKGTVLLTAPDLSYPAEGLFQFTQNKKIGFKNPAGKVVIPATWDDPYSHLSHFKGGLALVATKAAGDHRTGYIDQTGKVVWVPTPTAWQPAK